MKRIKELANIAANCLILIFIAYFCLKNKVLIGPIILLMALIPLFSAFLAKLEFKRLIPDIIFGAIDTGLLTIPAIVGGKFFGVLGAIVGGVVGDAVTDGIAGFFEGGISEWLRSKGVEESRLPLSCGFGKMSGCLLGSGMVLTVALLMGIRF